MKKLTYFNESIIVLAFLAFVMTSCTNSKEAPPFPYNESEYQQPVTRSFEFSKPDTIAWTTNKNAALKQLPSKNFDWSKLPAKQIDFGLAVPFDGKVNSKPFSLDSLPSIPFHIDSLPKAKLNIKITALGESEIIEGGVLGAMPNATRGVSSVNTDLGIPGTPRTIFKDSKGMLWIGVDNKIIRYDSENLEIYGLEQGLRTNAGTAIYEDSKGRIWVGNDGAISVIDFDAQIIYEIASELPSSTAYGFTEDDQGRLWVSRQYSGYDIIDLEDKTVHRFDQEKGLLGTFNLSPFKDKNSLIWLSTQAGINIIDLDAGKNMQLTTENGLLNPFTATFYEDKNGSLWVPNQSGAVVFDAERTTLSEYSITGLFEDAGGIVSVSQDQSDSFWFGSTNGNMYQWDTLKGMMQRFGITNSPSHAMVYTIEDGQGQIWVAAPQGGLYRIDPRTGRPGNFTISDGLSSNAIWNTLEARDGKMWIGSFEGIDIYDPEEKTIKHLGSADGLVSERNSRLSQDAKGRIWSDGNSSGVSIIDPEKETIYQLTTAQGLETDFISGLAEIREGLIWMGGLEGELISADMDNAILKTYLPTSEEEAFQNNVILKDHDDYVWVSGVGSGIQRIHPVTNERVFLTTANGLISNTVYSITVDEKNNIWAAMDLGVQMINIGTNEITTFTTKEGLAANDVYAIKVFKGEVYTGTSRGLTILKPQSQPNQDKLLWNAKTIGKAQGLNLLDFSQNSFTFDRNGKFWAGVQGALLTVMDEIVLDTKAAPTYITGINILDENQQFRDKEKIQKNRMQLDSIFWPNSNRSFSGKEIEKDTSNLALKKITWETVEGPYKMPVDLTLPYDQNYLSFSFNGVHFANPDQVVYRYILEGIDKNWSPVSDETESENYRDLPPGSYAFKVASKGFNDVWSEPSSLSFTILPPWWKTWWAYVIYACILGLLGLQVHKFQKARTLRMAREKAQKKELAQAKEIEKAYNELKATQSQLVQSEKMASLGELTAGIAHEIQNPLNFVNNFSEVNSELIEEMREELQNGNLEEVKSIAKDIDDNEQKIIFHGKRADSIVKGMLQHSRSSNGKKELTDVNVLADEYLRLAYHGLRAKDKSFNAKMETDFDPNIGQINIVSQDIGRVVLNLITNAFYVVDEKKKAGAEEYEPIVKVTTQKHGKNVDIKVIDNANGIPDAILDKIFQPFFTTKPSGKGTGLGLSLSYDIVRSHGGELTVNTEKGTGTEFTIRLPVS